MRYECTDPMDAASRVLDIARRLDLELDRLVLQRSYDGTATLHVALADPRCHAAAVFFARVDTLVSLKTEPMHV